MIHPSAIKNNPSQCQHLTKRNLNYFPTPFPLQSLLSTLSL